jgi:hypothetical protein
MRADASKRSVWDQVRQRDVKVFARWLQPATIARAASRAGVSCGKGPLNVVNLVWLGLVSALHPGKNFAGVLVLALKLLRDAPGWETSSLAARQRRSRGRVRRRGRSRHDPRGPDATAVSEEAFVQARRRLPWGFWYALTVLLAERFQAAHRRRVHWKEFRLLALDGTTVPLDNWRALADHFGTASRGKGRRRAQARLVLVEFAQARAPWRYELTPLAESEKTVAARLLDGLDADDLVLMDRGFWSFALLAQIAQQGAFFALRRTAQAHLEPLCRLGRDDRLVRYRPSHWPRSWAERGWPREMTLRVVSYQIRGFRPSAVVTNVLEPERVSREEWVRLAAVDEAGRVVEPGLYHRRWEIETTFRELKETQGMVDGLRSRTPAGIRYEVAGHVLLYLLVRWLMVEAAERAGLDDPLRLSFKAALAELQEMRQTLLLASPAHVRRVLWPRLLQRIASHRVPLRPGRHYARPGDHQPKAKGKGRYQPANKLRPQQSAKLERIGA